VLSVAGVEIPPARWDCFADDSFAGQVVMVTGAASGIGRSTARAFYDLGASVVLVDHNRAGLDALAGQLGERATPMACDISDGAQVEGVFASCDERFVRLDAVVAAAGIITAKPAFDIEPADWQRVLSINLVGTFSVLTAALRRMVPQRSGSLVAVGSDAGKRGGGGLIADAAYAASKAGVLSIVKSLAREFAGSGVRINALTPGPTDTPMHAAVSAELKQRIGAGLPVGRMGHPDDLAAAAVFLCSPAAQFVYAASLNVDGGSLYE
jgi:3-oxoacyl-[acyl-carrier protein] reductase